jgi:hypothetical protein
MKQVLLIALVSTIMALFGYIKEQSQVLFNGASAKFKSIMTAAGVAQ